MYSKIMLTGKRGAGIYATVDPCDAYVLSQYNWHLRETGGGHMYASHTLPSGKKVQMHRFILGYDGALIVDHINGDTLDNRRENLRIVTNAVNQRNRHKKMPGTKSKYLGVTHNGFSWIAQSTIGRENPKRDNSYIGSYRTEEEAHQAYLDYKKKFEC